VADDGFNFLPAERREAKRFEPPPWEQDKFDELARQRAEQEASAAEAAEAASVQAALAKADAEVAETAAEAEAPAVESAAAVAIEPADMPQVADASVEQMLAELAAEEPKATSAYWKMSVFVGSVLVVFGSMFLFWGMAALVGARSSGAVGVVGGSVVLLFGAGFVFGGLYVVVKNLRQRGVL
jgi:hypothetical protein